MIIIREIYSLCIFSNETRRTVLLTNQLSMFSLQRQKNPFCSPLEVTRNRMKGTYDLLREIRVVVRNIFTHKSFILVIFNLFWFFRSSISKYIEKPQ